MLRIHCVQLCYNLSDPAMEDLLYEAESARRFCGLTLAGPIPDESTILHFRHLLEQHELGQALFEAINAHLAGQGLRLTACYACLRIAVVLVFTVVFISVEIAWRSPLDVERLSWSARTCRQSWRLVGSGEMKARVES